MAHQDLAHNKLKKEHEMSNETLQVKSEIGKIERIASADLENTMLDNQDEADKEYGSA